MANNTTSTHQRLMNEAFESAKDMPNMSRGDFLNSLSPLSRLAVVLGTMNYQIENGGFSQWFHNFPVESRDEALGYILNVYTTNNVCEPGPVYKLVRDAMNAERMLHPSSLDDDSEWEQYDDELEVLDARYYSLNQEFLARVEAYLCEQVGR